MTLKKSGGDLVGRIFDFVLEQPINAFVDEDKCCTPGSTPGRAIVTLGRNTSDASYRTERARNAERQDTVGD